MREHNIHMFLNKIRDKEESKKRENDEMKAIFTHESKLHLKIQRRNTEERRFKEKNNQQEIVKQMLKK